MRGSYLPYRLRQNKAIDRFAFLELLNLLNRHLEEHISSYMYVGFGGPSLEDYKIIHSQFNITKMISLEMDENAHKRQKFNLPLKCIDCRWCTSKEFIDEFVRTEPTIIWLDYTDPKELRNQVEEFQAVVTQLENFDICKITLNASASSLGELKTGMSQRQLLESRFNKLRNRLGVGELFPGILSYEQLDRPGYPNALLQVLQFAADQSLEGQPNHKFQPLTSYSYADGQQMLTLTGIKLAVDVAPSFLQSVKLNDWPLGNMRWAKPIQINIPDLTFRERFEIDSQLPGSSAEDITERLNFYFSDDREESIEMLKMYLDFYRQAPYFSEVII